MENKNNRQASYKSVQEKQVQKRAKRKTQKRNRRMLALVGVILLAGGLYSLYGFLMTYIADIDIVEPVTWENVLDCRAWSFQQESVTVTELPGTVVPMINEGERISKGVEIGRFNYQNSQNLYEEGNRRLYSPIAGILSYEVDGLEFVNMKRDYQILTVDLIESKLAELGYFTETENGGFTGIIQDKLDQESGGQAQEQTPAAGDTQPKAVEAGKGIFKVTDNLSDCYLYLRTEGKLETGLQPGDTVNLRLETETGRLSGKAEVIERAPLGVDLEAWEKATAKAAEAAAKASGDPDHPEDGDGQSLGGGEQPGVPGEPDAGDTGAGSAGGGANAEAGTDGNPSGADPEQSGQNGENPNLVGGYPAGGHPVGEAAEEEIQVPEPTGWGILVKLQSGLEPVRHSREHRLELVISTEEVGAVSSGALVEKNGATGVYLYKKNTVVWTPVEVLRQENGRMIFRGVEAGDTVITRPWLVRDGMKLRLGS